MAPKRRKNSTGKKKDGAPDPSTAPAAKHPNHTTRTNTVMSTPKPSRTSVLERPSGKVQMHRNPVCDDTLRWVLQGRITGGSFYGFKDGEAVKIKSLKQEAISSGLHFSQKDLDGHKLAAKICAEFNATVPINKQAFVGPSTTLMSSKDHVDSQKRLIAKKGQSLLVVEAPDGPNMWFNSNNGAANEEYRFPNFFSHWSWIHTERKCIVCCLQGVRGAANAREHDGNVDYYRFVDPAIMSDTSGKYGMRDLGRNGVLEWFKKHKCNDLCKRLDIDGEVPGTSQGANKKKNVKAQSEITLA